ncbi:MAG: hypothetical protein WCK11_03700 [Candidatus Falkowbacteria bacterium]
MKIVASVKNFEIALRTKLIRSGCIFKQSKSTLIIDLPLVLMQPDAELRYQIVSDLENAIFLIDVSENGGAKESMGNATIVCGGLTGKKITPYYVARGRTIPSGIHAQFGVPVMVSTVAGYRKKNIVDIEVQQHWIRQQESEAWIETKQLYFGPFIEMPKQLKHFQAAAEAAWKKCQCIDCRHVHYAKLC